VDLDVASGRVTPVPDLCAELLEENAVRRRLAGLL
jgi:hypothetical protein